MATLVLVRRIAIGILGGRQYTTGIQRLIGGIGMLLEETGDPAEQAADAISVVVRLLVLMVVRDGVGD